jgi:hypothetical protein
MCKEQEINNNSKLVNFSVMPRRFSFAEALLSSTYSVLWGLYPTKVAALPMMFAYLQPMRFSRLNALNERLAVAMVTEISARMMISLF